MSSHVSSPVSSAPAEIVTYLEVWRPDGLQVVVLSGTSVSIGRADEHDVTLAHDAQVSSLHAALQAYGTSWAIRDLGSRNGTIVAGKQLLGERALHHGDTIQVGQTRLVFRRAGGATGSTVVASERAPELTPRERDVLIALCRPLFSSAVFHQPATTKEIATDLVVTEAAVKQHLLNLYGKFGLDSDNKNRRVELANDALRRGAITPTDIDSGRE